MSLRIKIIFLTIAPLLLVTGVLAFINMNQLHELSEQEIKIFEDNLLDSKKQELQHYVSLALTSIDHIIRNKALDEATARSEVKFILNQLTYGEDGYFFVYDTNGVNLVHPILSDLVGQNLYDLQDVNNHYVIRDLLNISKSGGGFHRYLWNKPSSGIDAEKMSFVVQVPRWNWMIGTGLYIDDIALEISKIRSQVKDNIKTTLITILIITGFMVVIIVLIGLMTNLHQSKLADARLRELAHKSVRFQVAERRRFARELHDGINQLMVSIKFSIESAIQKCANNADSMGNDLTQSIVVINQTIQEVRRISRDLRPSLLDDMGLEVALNNLLKEFSKRTHIEINSDLKIPNIGLKEDIEITIYRVVQEALTNIERHAGECRITIKIRQRPTHVKLVIQDNGNGFDIKNAHKNEGIGLSNMRERVELLGGEFSISSEINKGTTIIALLNYEVIN